MNRNVRVKLNGSRGFKSIDRPLSSRKFSVPCGAKGELARLFAGSTFSNKGYSPRKAPLRSVLFGTSTRECHATPPRAP